MLGYRGLVFMYNGEQPTSNLNWTLVDFREAKFLGLHTPTWFPCFAVTLFMWVPEHEDGAWAQRLCHRPTTGRPAVNAGIRVGPHMMINFVIIGFLAALSAVIFYSERRVGEPPTTGQLFELWVIHRGGSGRQQADGRLAAT